MPIRASGLSQNNVDNGATGEVGGADLLQRSFAWADLWSN
jgi:hypothetical protein